MVSLLQGGAVFCLILRNTNSIARRKWSSMKQVPVDMNSSQDWTLGFAEVFLYEPNVTYDRSMILMHYQKLELSLPEISGMLQC